MSKEVPLINASQKPKAYYARHFFPGVAEYHNERINIDMNVMKKMCKSMVGCPVYVQHQNTDIANIHNADGLVSDNFINPNDGWMWSKFLAVSDQAHDAIKNGWSVSNAYIPTETGKGGSKHNVDYDREILNAEFQHLAIVPNPRYEQAKIFTEAEYNNYNKELKAEMMTNSKTAENSKTGKPIMKLFNFKKEAATEITEGTQAELADGTLIPVQEMINAVEAKIAADKAVAEKVITEEEKQNTKVKVGDVEMTVAELAQKYNDMKEEEAKKAKKKKEDDDKAAENSVEAKENFKELENAKETFTQKVEPIIDLDSDKLARGKRLA